MPDTILQRFLRILKETPDLSMPAAAIQALTEAISTSQASTMVEFMESLTYQCNALKQHTRNHISIVAGCDAFLRYFVNVTQTSSLDTTKEKLVAFGTAFVSKGYERREQIACLAMPFLTRGVVVLIHSYSRVVIHLLKRATEEGAMFSVYVTEARPTQKGQRAYEELKALGVPVQIILDSAIGYFIEKVDMVFVGAEGVVESGGIINQIGTYQMGIIAKAAGKPFYAVTEAFKFVRLFPLNQYDLPRPTVFGFKKETQDFLLNNPLVDYTPPEYITLLFTDQGIMTPSGVSDELTKLFMS